MTRLVTVLIILAVLGPGKVFSDSSENTLTDEYSGKPQREAGLMVAMAESGSSLGAFFSWPFGSKTHFGVGIDAFFLRDSRQVEYVDPFYGGMYTLNKVNNVYLFDAMVSVKHRFFAEDMDESFRPFLGAGIGPIYGVNFPEEDELPVQERWTVGGYFGGGVDVSVDVKYFVSVRAQYRIVPFYGTLGERKDHSMFELRFNVGWRFD